MGFWSTIQDWFSGKDDATRIQEMASEISRYADRYENAGQSENAARAREYAARVSAARTLKEAKALYNEFKVLMSKYDDEGYQQRHRRPEEDDRYNDTDDDWSDDS